MKDLIPLQAADIVLAGAPQGKQGFISRQIAFWTRMPGEPPTLFTHAGIIGRPGRFTDASIIEMTWPSQREVSLAKYYRDSRLKIYRWNGMNEQVAGAIIREMRDNIGYPYGWTKIITTLADGLIGKILNLAVMPIRFVLNHVFQANLKSFEVFLFRRLDITGMYFCSAVVARCFKEYAGVDFGVEPNGATPDDIADYLENSDTFTLAYEQ